MFQCCLQKKVFVAVTCLFVVGLAAPALAVDVDKPKDAPEQKKPVSVTPFKKIVDSQQNNPYPGLELEYRRYESPRPLKCWVAIIDLTQPVEIVATCGSEKAKPDHETLCENTLEFAQGEDVDFAINASAFAPFRKKAGEPMQVVGLGACEGKVYSPQDDRFGAFILEKDGDIVISNPPYKLEEIDDAVSGFHMLLIDGKDVVEKTTKGVNPNFIDVNPRTAIGVDQKGKKLFVIVADGRQEGVSEGMTLYELAHMFADLGAYHALNLDGGGSTAMILKDPKTGEHKLVNKSIHGGKKGHLRQVANNLGFNFKKAKPVDKKKPKKEKAAS